MYKKVVLNPPKMVFRGEDGTFVKKVKAFHNMINLKIAKYTVPTLRKTAWQLYIYYEENKKYKDIAFIKTLIEYLEFVIQKKSNSNWTVMKAQFDMRGRGSSRYVRNRQKVPISKDLSKVLKERIRVTEERLNALKNLDEKKPKVKPPE